MGVCNCFMFCCTLLYVHFSIAIILMGKRELVALLNLSSWCLVMVERLFLAVPRGCLRFMVVVFPDHTHLLFLRQNYSKRVLSKTSTKGMRDIKSSGNISIIHRHTHQPVAGRFLIIVIPKIMKAWFT